MKKTEGRDIALKEAVEENRGRLVAVIRRFVRDQAEAEDVMQDVFEELVTAYDLGLVIERVGSWLMTVARNKVFDRLRKKKVRRDYETLAQKGGEPFLAADESQAWLREEIITALELLPAEQREVFVMYELEGMAFKEIAAATKVPIGTLMARKKYAVDFLRQYLQEIYDEYE